MDECGINGIVHKEDTVSGKITDNGGMQGELEKEGVLVGEVGLPKCMCSNDYDDLVNKPSIEGVELMGDKSFEELNLQKITNTELENMLTL